MKHFRVFMFVLLLAVAALPALAQETPDAVPDAPVVTVIEEGETPAEGTPASPVVIVDEAENPALLIALAVAGVVIVLFGGFIVANGKHLKDSAPPWVVELLLTNRGYVEGRLDKGFDALDSATALTPNTLDDLLVRYGREWVERRIREFYGDDAPDVPPQG